MDRPPTILDVPLGRLRRMLRATVQLVGPNYVGVAILRQAIKDRRQLIRRRAGGEVPHGGA